MKGPAAVEVRLELGRGNDKGVGDHSRKHLGPVWTASLKASHTKWGDIIPPYTDDQGVSFPGLNYNARRGKIEIRLIVNGGVLATVGHSIN